MKKWWEYFKTEVFSRLFSSKKRIIKFIAICLIPFLYGFVCIWAFWNPIENLGNAPMAIVNQSKPVTLVMGTKNSTKSLNENINSNSSTDNDIVARVNQIATTSKTKLNIGVATYYVACGTDGVINPDSEVKSFDEVLQSNSLQSFIEYTNSNQNVAIYTYNQTFNLKNTPTKGKDLSNITPEFIYNSTTSSNIKIVPNFSIIRDYFNWWKNNPNPQNIIQYNNKNDKYKIILQSEREWNTEQQCYEIIPQQQLNNVQYLEGNDADNMADFIPSPVPNQPGQWKVIDDKYWLQVQIPEDFNINAISIINGYLIGTNQSIEQTSNFIQDLKNEPINIWTSFKQNFLFGQFMKISSEFKSAILLNMVPNLVTQTISTSITNILNNNDKSQIYFQGENKPLIIDDQSQQLLANHEYAVYDNTILTKIKNNNENIQNFPTLNSLTKTLVGDNNSFTSEVATYYTNAVNTNIIYKTIINRVINNSFIVEPYGKPISLTDAQLNLIFGNAKGIQSIFELNAELLNSLGGGNVTIPGTDYSVTWEEFCNTWMNGLKKNVGLTPLFSSQSNIITKNDINQNLGKNISSWMAYLSSGSSKLENLDGIVTNNIQGSEYAIYGIGLGEFFVCIGVWVGILMQTFVFDRNVRRPKKEAWNIGRHNKFSPKGNKWARFNDATSWWFAKNTLMSLTTIIQVTFLMITIGLLGWFQIGSSFGLLYLSILFSALIWTTFIQSLWFLFRDEVVGKFVVILFLIVNITSGWGTFPPVMQFKFFDIISNIAPFTYCIHNQGLIIYGVAVNGTNTLDTLAILKWSGIQLIYLSIAISLAMYEGMNLQKITFFGSANAKKVAHALELLGNTNPHLIITKTNKKGEIIKNVNWDELDWTYQKEICDATNSLYPSIVDFKWYTKKYKCNTYTIVE